MGLSESLRQTGGEEADAADLLAERIVQLAAEADAFLFGDANQLGFEIFSLGDIDADADDALTPGGARGGDQIGAAKNPVQ